MTNSQIHSKNDPAFAAGVPVSSLASAADSNSSAPPPELLAPAGDWDCAKAAVENGADAIYFGLDRFNARMRARNFTESDLPGLMEFLHRRGVKGYVTFNTLVFANEIQEAENYLRSVIASGVDAAIVQDIGMCRLIRKISPDFPIHASTQMTITSAAGVEFARELGCHLVVLARECSIKEIEKIQAALAANNSAGNQAGAAGFPLEVFVHGALCVAYSGQCLTSESLGGRSANRGECAQACRMPYELISDGQTVPLGDKRYLLSPQDLAGLEVLPDLAARGIASLKIEGRLKSPEYVANITRVYRRALDNMFEHKNRATGHSPNAFKEESAGSRYDLEMAFSRGLYTGWFRGINNQELAHARFGKKRGVFLGQVKQVRHQTVLLELEAPLRPGDGIVFDAGRPDEKEQGGRVYAIHARGPETELEFGRGDIDFSRVHAGDRVWKTSDPELDRRLRQSFAGDKPRFQRPLEIEAHGFEGVPLSLIARDKLGHVAKATSSMALVRAANQPLTETRLREQLGRLGGTPFKLAALRSHLQGSVLIPVSELNRLRRELVSELESLRIKPKRWTLLSNSLSTPSPLPDSLSATASIPAPGLIILVRNLPQLEAALDAGARTLYCEFEDPKKYREAVRHFRAAKKDPDAKIFVSPPRIYKMGEEWILKIVRSSDADGYLVRNYDQLNFFQDCPRRGDFSLNVANSLAADYFINRSGLERVTASYDLNFLQLEALLKSAPPRWFEITIHQHMPMFHMEHCVFCAFLTKGTDYTNCGRPCDRHEVKLRDRAGSEHPLKADAGCRNTVFNAIAQTGAEYVSRMMAWGARHFRIEFLNETPSQVAQTMDRYQQLLSGKLNGAQLWRELKLLNQLGVTRGQM
jgi:U32 family peptidase